MEHYLKKQHSYSSPDPAEIPPPPPIQFQQPMEVKKEHMLNTITSTQYQSNKQTKLLI